MLPALPGRGYGYTRRMVPWLKAHAEHYDLIIVHGLWNYASLGSWIALHRSKTRYFLFTHGMLDPWFIEAFPIKALLKSVFWRLFEHRVLRDAQGVLFTTEEERELAARSFRPYIAKPYVVGLGTRDAPGDRDAQRRAFAIGMPRLEGRRFILFLSRIHPKKGIDLLIRAFAAQALKHPDLDLVIAGPDQVGLQRTLEALASSLQLGARVHWPGMLTGDVKWGAFACARFFALPSHQENFGIAVAEALAIGTPVLVTNKVNIWREIEAERAGIVVNDDLDGIASGLARLSAMSDDERAIMSANARRCFVDRYDIEQVAKRLLQLAEAKPDA
jgi:glycosyltransferase involved in cell wall biosynthesis